jgi:hypothetical protein
MKRVALPSCRIFVAFYRFNPASERFLPDWEYSDTAHCILGLSSSFGVWGRLQHSNGYPTGPEYATDIRGLFDEMEIAAERAVAAIR